MKYNFREVPGKKAFNVSGLIIPSNAVTHTGTLNRQFSRTFLHEIGVVAWEHFSHGQILNIVLKTTGFTELCSSSACRRKVLAFLLVLKSGTLRFRSAQERFKEMLTVRIWLRTEPIGLQVNLSTPHRYLKHSACEEFGLLFLSDCYYTN